MSETGQTEKSGRATGKSALPSITDIVRQARQVRKVPKAEVNSERRRPRYGPLRVDDPAVGVIQALEPEPRIMRYELNDFEWTAIKPILTNKPRSIRRANDRRVLNGIFGSEARQPLMYSLADQLQPLILGQDGHP